MTAVCKPCPFCGSTPHKGPTKMIQSQTGDPFQRFEIWCPQRHATINSMNEQAAITAWNTRADDGCIAELVEALEWIAANYENVNINHVDFRVDAKHLADAALAKVKGGAA